MSTEKEMRDTIASVLASATDETKAQAAIGNPVCLYAGPIPGKDTGSPRWPTPPFGDPEPWAIPQIGDPASDKATAEKLGAATQLIKTVHTLLKQGNLRTALKLVREFLKETK